MSSSMSSGILCENILMVTYAYTYAYAYMIYHGIFLFTSVKQKMWFSFAKLLVKLCTANFKFYSWQYIGDPSKFFDVRSSSMFEVIGAELS